MRLAKAAVIGLGKVGVVGILVVLAGLLIENNIDALNLDAVLLERGNDLRQFLFDFVARLGPVDEESAVDLAVGVLKSHPHHAEFGGVQADIHFLLGAAGVETNALDDLLGRAFSRCDEGVLSGGGGGRGR